MVTGPWYSSTPYTVLFDSLPVPTTLVQEGVLRCYCPGESNEPNRLSVSTQSLSSPNCHFGVLCFLAHEVGLVSLQVAFEGHVVSNSVMFEYKEPPKSPLESVGAALQDHKRDTADSNSLLKLTLLHRLEAVNQRLHVKQEQTDHCSDLVKNYPIILLFITLACPLYLKKKIVLVFL